MFCVSSNSDFQSVTPGLRALASLWKLLEILGPHSRLNRIRTCLEPSNAQCNRQALQVILMHIDVWEPLLSKAKVDSFEVLGLKMMKAWGPHHLLTSPPPSPQVQVKISCSGAQKLFMSLWLPLPQHDFTKGWQHTPSLLFQLYTIGCHWEWAAPAPDSTEKKASCSLHVL